LPGLLLCAALVTYATPALAQGWGLPNLNPFSSKGKLPTGGHVDDGSGGFSLLPSLPKWPSMSSKSSRSGPSTWTRMTNGTKSLVSKTTDALNPFDDDEPQSRSVTGSNSIFSNASTSKKASEKKSFLPSWLYGGSEEKYEKPKTVNDFLSQPRPELP
jgi:hypothetical protein